MIAVNSTHLFPETDNIKAYLATSDIIDFEDPAIQDLAQQFIDTIPTEIERAKAIYEWVRDRIPHSCDIQGKVVTCKASAVLQHREGICFAKAHLLAALFRRVGIPTGFCYQRLVFDDVEPDYLTLHGLNAVYLKDLQQWMRLDARGNKPGVQAEFDLNQEKLAYPVRTDLNEADDFTIYVQPKTSVIQALQFHSTLDQLINHLPCE